MVPCPLWTVISTPDIPHLRAAEQPDNHLGQLQDYQTLTLSLVFSELELEVVTCPLWTGTVISTPDIPHLRAAEQLDNLLGQLQDH